jgi:hypothetical protein
MKRFLLLLLIITLTAPSYLKSQDYEWRYTKQISFPAVDSGKVQPYLCTVDANGKLYVVSSRAASSRAHNAIFFLNQGDTVFTKLIDFHENGDSDTLTGNIGHIRGIAALGTDIFITASQPFPRTAPNTVATTYLYPNGDTTLVEKFGFNILGAGYGTYIHGAAVTKDTVLFVGTTAKSNGPGPGPRFYNFSYDYTATARGSWISALYETEPGGLHTGGADVIRDVAVIPGGNYNDPETPFYTSRNNNTLGTTGGLAVWAGGTQFGDPAGYIGMRITDAIGILNLGTNIPYGITVGSDSLLWVAGTDTTKRWVKAFNVELGFATEVWELPGQFSETNPMPEGAPLRLPSDVAVSPDGKVAYVIDAQREAAYMFQQVMTSINENDSRPSDFSLAQNYPNPFNPATIISYSVPVTGNVKIAVTNSLGQEVKILVNGYKNSGSHSVSFDGSSLTSGIYFYTLSTGSGSITKKMMLVK